MKKKKLKFKKRVWVLFVLVLFIGIAFYVGLKIREDLIYKETIEYKLLEIGYTLDEANLIQEKVSEEYIESLFDQERNETLLNIIGEKYYLEKNLERYLDFANNNTYTSDLVIALVNTNNDYNYYEYDIESDTSLDYLLLVNKFYYLNSDYEPTDLVSISNKYYYGEDHQIRSIVYDAFVDMWNEAYNEGIYLIINSSYRDYETQDSVYNYYKDSYGASYADEIAARAGYSEHQTGLALDIFSKDYTTTSNFTNSPAHIWLQNNAYRFGFIERYPSDKENITGFGAESWHWRYVGVEVATYIHENDITFDEYYAYFIEN